MMRQKGYLWLAAVLATALLIVVLIGLRPAPPAAIPTATTRTVSSMPHPSLNPTPQAPVLTPTHIGKRSPSCSTSTKPTPPTWCSSTT